MRPYPNPNSRVLTRTLFPMLIPQTLTLTQALIHVDINCIVLGPSLLGSTRKILALTSLYVAFS